MELSERDASLKRLPPGLCCEQLRLISGREDDSREDALESALPLLVTAAGRVASPRDFVRSLLPDTAYRVQPPERAAHTNGLSILLIFDFKNKPASGEQLFTAQTQSGQRSPVPLEYGGSLPSLACLLGSVPEQDVVEFVLQQLLDGRLQRQNGRINKFWQTVGATANGTMRLADGSLPMEVPEWMEDLLERAVGMLGDDVTCKLMVDLYHKPCGEGCLGSCVGGPMHNAHFDARSAAYRAPLVRHLSLTASDAHTLYDAAATNAPHLPGTSTAISTPLANAEQAELTASLCHEHGITATGQERYSALDDAVRKRVTQHCADVEVSMPTSRKTSQLGPAATVEEGGYRSISLLAVAADVRGLPSKCALRYNPSVFGEATLLVPINANGATAYYMQAELRGSGEQPAGEEPLRLNANFGLHPDLRLAYMHGVKPREA